MPPGGGGGGGGGGEHGCTAQDHPPATVRRDEDASTPPLPAITPLPSELQEDKKRQRHEHEHQPAASLPEGPLAEILARVPYRSLCRFKCVSKPWLALCSSPDIRKRSPQTLTGFFYPSRGRNGLHFRSLPGTGPPLVDPRLSFLSETYTDAVCVYQVCGGLLLCSCWKPYRIQAEGEYVVCNPATEEWTVLPPLVYLGQEIKHLFSAYVGFDAAVPTRFVVFGFPPPSIAGNDSREMGIYSSETGQWSYVQTKWAPGTIWGLNPCGDKCIFHNGTMHLPTIHSSIVTVDSEGKVWGEIKTPNDLPNSSDIGISQGRLYAWQQKDDIRGTQLYMWVLEDYGTGKWTLTNIVNFSELFGRNFPKGAYGYKMLALHPDCNVIFLTNEKKMTVSYNLDSHKVDVIFTEPMFGLPYVPSLVELPSVGH